MLTGLAILFMIAFVPIIIAIARQGTVGIEKPKKRKYLFEDENGDKDNPFHTEKQEEESDEWRYSFD